MFIECLVQREGPSVMDINGFRYVFEENEHRHKVAFVMSSEHQQWLLRSENFRAYTPPSDDVDPLDAPLQVEFHTKDGNPWKTKGAAAMWVSRNNGAEYDIVEVAGGGFGVVRKG